MLKKEMAFLAKNFRKFLKFKKDGKSFEKGKFSNFKKDKKDFKMKNSKERQRAWSFEERMPYLFEGKG